MEQAQAQAESFGFRLDLAPSSRHRKGQINNYQSLPQKQTTIHCPSCADTWPTCRGHLGANLSSIRATISGTGSRLQSFFVTVTAPVAPRHYTQQNASAYFWYLVNPVNLEDRELDLEMMEENVFMPGEE